MNQIEIFRVSEPQLRTRLAAIPAESREAEMIRRELARRVGCC
jgi:hypothetical protein